MAEFTPDSLRDWREKNNVTQEELAQKVGVTSSAIRNFEKGRVNKMGARTVRSIESLMREERAEYGFAANSETGSDTPFHLVVAAEFEALVEVLKSKELSDKAKEAKYKNTIAYWYEHLDEYRAAFLRNKGK